MRLREAHRLLYIREQLIETARNIRKEAYRMLELHYGLEAGVTWVTDEEGNTGVYQKTVNYFEGELPWLHVHFDPPLPGWWGHERRFYGKWKIVPPPSDPPA